MFSIDFEFVTSVYICLSIEVNFCECSCSYKHHFHIMLITNYMLLIMFIINVISQLPGDCPTGIISSRRESKFFNQAL